MAILYPGANGLPSTFYVDGERQILLLQAVEQLHAMSDTLREQLGGLNTITAEAVARVRLRASAIVPREVMQRVHTFAATSSGSSTDALRIPFQLTFTAHPTTLFTD
jgi:hypothetical protein